jgi:RHS repeat-associated protein
VGGLLSVVRGDAPYFTGYDANGNATDYASASGTAVAHYEFDPFGNTTAATGSMADAFAHRFSTKYWDSETELYYYGHRYYRPGVGRWASRDPIGERGGLSLLAFLDNCPASVIDVLGLASITRKFTCVVDLIMKHGSKPPGALDPNPPQGKNLSPCLRWGFFGCYADRYNKLVPSLNRIPGIPSVHEAQQWPPQERRTLEMDYDAFNEGLCENVKDLIAVGKGVQRAINDLCETGCCIADEVRVSVSIDKAMQGNIDNARGLIESRHCNGSIKDLPKATKGTVKCPGA